MLGGGYGLKPLPIIQPTPPYIFTWSAPLLGEPACLNKAFKVITLPNNIAKAKHGSGIREPTLPKSDTTDESNSKKS